MLSLRRLTQLYWPKVKRSLPSIPFQSKSGMQYLVVCIISFPRGWLPAGGGWWRGDIGGCARGWSRCARWSFILYGGGCTEVVGFILHPELPSYDFIGGVPSLHLFCYQVLCIMEMMEGYINTLSLHLTLYSYSILIIHSSTRKSIFWRGKKEILITIGNSCSRQMQWQFHSDYGW